jgi:hypothetical protein
VPTIEAYLVDDLRGQTSNQYQITRIVDGQARPGKGDSFYRKHRQTSIRGGGALDTERASQVTHTRMALVHQDGGHSEQ